MPKSKTPKKPTLLVLSNIPEKFETAGPERDLCKACTLGNGYHKAFIPEGYTHKVLLVFQVPPSADEITLTRELLREIKMPAKDVAYLSAVRCLCDEPNMTQIRACRPYVLRALEVLKPERVFALGSIAAKSLTNSGTGGNVAKLRGRPFDVHGSMVYVTYSPSSILEGGTQYKARILEDLTRGANPTINYPTNEHPTGTYIGFDTEYAPDKTLLTVGLANTEVALSVEPQDSLFYATIQRVEEIPVLCGHSVTGDVDQLVELQLAQPQWLTGKGTRDSLLMSRMVDENRGKGGYDLESLMVSNQNVQPWKKPTESISKEDATKWPEYLRRERCRLDAWASVSLVESLLDKTRWMPVELTHRIAMSIHRIKHAGVMIDAKKLAENKQALEQEREEARAKLTIAAQGHGMSEFIPTNDEHIRELLFKRMKLPVTKKTKKEKLAACDQITLKQFGDRREVQLLTSFNKADKSYSTNIEGVLEFSTPVEGTDLRWMPVNINPLGARTGRRSSSEPNMQNWPEKMRSMVVSRFPGGKILEFDYKSLEVFLLAFEAKDDKLFDYFANRGGYIAIAKDMWKKEIAKGTPEYRATKSVVLGTNYNMQTPKMANNLWVLGVHLSEDYKEHTRKTDRLRNSYLDMFPGLRPYMDKQERYLLANQCAVSRTGRVRHLPLTDGEETPGYGHMVNQAINYPIQSLASDVTGSALIDCEARLCDIYKTPLLEYHARLMQKDWPQMPIIINEIHDSLIFDLPALSNEKDTIKLLRETMTEVVSLREYCPSFLMPLRLDMKIGAHWGMTE